MPGNGLAPVKSAVVEWNRAVYEAIYEARTQLFVATRTNEYESWS